MKAFLPGIRAAAALLLISPLAAVAATITALDEAGFNALVPGGELRIENLQGYPQGSYPASQDFADFTYSVSSGAVSISEFFELGVGLNKALSATAISDRLFEFSPTDLVFAFATDMRLNAFGSGPQSFAVTVTGNSGASTFQFDRAAADWRDWVFYGYHDPLGLRSIKFSNLGYDDGTGIERSNFYFDDILTVQAVPVPPAILLFASGLAALLTLRKSRRSA